jgi:hypothetical protein
MMRNIRQNLFFAFVFNALAVPSAAGALYPLFGLLLNPMIASAAMSLSSVTVVSKRAAPAHGPALVIGGPSPDRSSARASKGLAQGAATNARNSSTASRRSQSSISCRLTGPWWFTVRRSSRAVYSIAN